MLKCRRSKVAPSVAPRRSVAAITEPRGDQAGDLGDDERRDDRQTGMGLQQLQAGGVVGVVGVE